MTKAYQIKFGTDGWRAIIAQDYTIGNLERVAEATAKWILQLPKTKRKAVIGYDCRFGGELFMKRTAEIFAYYNIQTICVEGFVSTPMVSMGTKYFQADAGIVITASHNPPSYNGFKIKAHYGGPAVPSEISKVESLIKNSCSIETKSFDAYMKDNLITYEDLCKMYVDDIHSKIDFKLLDEKKLQIGYDAMYGAGQNAMKTLFPKGTFLHCDYNPGFGGQAPEPIARNLEEFQKLIKTNKNINSGLATDGDADRIGLYDENGNFVDSHHILLLLIEYLTQHKKMQGIVANSFSCTSKIDLLCKKYKLEQMITKIGFKYICELMTKHDILVGGEESGGIAIAGHIPERDGIFIGLTIWEFMCKTGKSLNELVQDMYDRVGTFWVDRNDLHLPNSVKQDVVNKCKTDFYKRFGSLQVTKTEKIDGIKFHLGEEKWVMVRPSGTEPLLRIYAQGKNKKESDAVLSEVESTLLH